MPEAPAAGVGASVGDELAHLDRFGGGELWENHGWCVRVSSGDREFLLWLAFYILRGTEGGRFTVADVRVRQTIAVWGRFDAAERAEMQDVPFHVSGVNWSEYEPPPRLVVGVEGDAAVWSDGERRHESAPPRWRVSGRAGALEVDLTFAALAPAAWFDGFDLIEGYEALAWIEGTIADDESTHEVTGFGQHEKVHTGVPIQRRDGAGWLTLPAALRHMWHCGAGRRLAFSMLANQPGEEPDRLNGHVVVDGRSIRFRRGQVRFDETQTWLDPRSGVTIPVGWRILVDHPEGRLDLAVRSYARAYYLWDYIRGSTSLLYWLLSEADATWEDRLGGRVDESLRYVAHTNRPFLYWGGHVPALRAGSANEQEDAL